MYQKIIEVKTNISEKIESRKVTFLLDHEEVEIKVPYIAGTDLLAEEIFIAGIPCKAGEILSADSVTFKCTLSRDVTLGILYGKKAIQIPKDSKIEVCNGWVTAVKSPKPIKYETVTANYFRFDIDNLTDQEPQGILEAHLTEDSRFCGLIFKKDTDFKFNNEPTDRYYMKMQNIAGRGIDFTVFTSGTVSGKLARKIQLVGKKIISEETEVSVVILHEKKDQWFYFLPEKMQEFGFKKCNNMMILSEKDMIPRDIGKGPGFSGNH